MVAFPGIYPPLVTPMHEDLSVDLQTLRKLVTYQVDSGVAGLWIAGATGEGQSLSADERFRITETVIDAAAGRIKVIVHVGSLDPIAALTLANHAEKCGADAIASLPPFFYGVTTQEVVDYYRRLADGCGLPLFLYHLPVATHVPITPTIVEKLLDHDAVRGVKFSDPNLTMMHRIKNLAPDRLTLLFGMDSMFLAGLVMGADGGVGGTQNYMPHAFIRILKAHADGDLAAARELQHRMTRFMADFSAGLSPVVFVKQAMPLLGIDCGPMRPPLSMPSADQRRSMQRCWDKHLEWLQSLGCDPELTSTSTAV